MYSPVTGLTDGIALNRAGLDKPCSERAFRSFSSNHPASKTTSTNEEEAGH